MGRRELLGVLRLGLGMVVLRILKGCREARELLLVVGSVERSRGYGVEEFVDGGALVVDMGFMKGVHSLLWEWVRRGGRRVRMVRVGEAGTETDGGRRRSRRREGLKWAGVWLWVMSRVRHTPLD